jgi:hypothetical protein
MPTETKEPTDADDGSVGDGEPKIYRSPAHCTGASGSPA